MKCHILWPLIWAILFAYVPKMGCLGLFIRVNPQQEILHTKPKNNHKNPPDSEVKEIESDQFGLHEQTTGKLRR